MESKASAASEPQRSSGFVRSHSNPDSEYTDSKNEDTVYNVVSRMNINKNALGSDSGSETDEGFVSGGEEFETDSVSGKVALVDPYEETVAKVTLDNDLHTPVTGDLSEFSMSEVVRPIAKVSVDDDEEDVVGGLEGGDLAAKVVQSSVDETVHQGVEVVNSEDDRVGPAQTQAAKGDNFSETVDQNVSENVEVSADGRDRKVEDEMVEGNVPSVVGGGGLASEQYEVGHSKGMDEKLLGPETDDSLNDKQKASTVGENAGSIVSGNTIVKGANDDAEPAGAAETPSDVNLTSEGDSVVEIVKINMSDPGVVVVEDVKDSRDLEFQGVENNGVPSMPSDNAKLSSEGDTIIEGADVNFEVPGVAVVGDAKETRDVETQLTNGVSGANEFTTVEVDGQHAKNNDDQFMENKSDDTLGGTTTINSNTDDAEPAGARNLDASLSVPYDMKLTCEGDSTVEHVDVNVTEPGVVVVGDTRDSRDVEFQVVEKIGVPSLPSDDTKLVFEGNSIVEDVKDNFLEPGDGFKQVQEDGQHAKNHDDHSLEENGNVGAQTGEVEISGVEKNSYAVQQNSNGENEVDSDHTKAVPSDEPSRVDEVQPRESEVKAYAVPDNDKLLHDGVSNPVADEGQLKATDEYDAAENLGQASIVGTDGEGKHADEEIEDSITDGETEGMLFESSEAAKQFLEDLEKASGVGSFSATEDAYNITQKNDGQIVTDSEEEVDTDEEGESKELFDPAALAALLKAARGAGSDGGNITITSQDGSRLFSVDRPAGLGSSLQSVKPGPRPSRGSIVSPSGLRVEAESDLNISEDEKEKLENLQQIRIKFLRLVQRLGFAPEESMVAQVLYRMTLVAGRQTGGLFSLDAAKRRASELEVEGRDDLNFIINILVLGKAGVGKSATINSIFGETKTQIDAYGPATCGVREIIGVVGGVKLRVFDTPGLKSSAMEQSINRKILSNVKNFTKKCPPDIILYVDRLDTQTRDLNDLPLLRSITSVLGASIWRNAIVTLTHAASAPPDGPTGAPLSYDVFIAQRSHVVQQIIGQAVGDLRLMNPTLMNPVSLAENHPSCRKNRDGEKVLPNGQSWRPQLLLLCYSMKILSEASSLSKPKDPFDHKKLFGFRVRSPPLPYLLSWLLQSRTHPKLSTDQGGDNGDSDVDMADLSDSDQDEDEDEYDQLPAFKPLRKSQIAKLSGEQKKAYFDEYEYRVKLLQKKQWREELKRMREIKKKGEANGNIFGETEEGDDSPAAVAVPLPDMVLPASFDGDNAAYRYRFLEPTSQFLTRPVLDTHGWDHDCGYDGVNLEHSLAIASQFPAAYAVQITKDKKDFNIHLDSSVAVKHGEKGSTMVGFDIQNIGKQLAYIVRGETKFNNFRRNKTAAGMSLTFLGESLSTGVKVEDQIAIGKRLVLIGSTGTVRSQGDAAYGANMEVRIREADFPIGQDQSSLGFSLVKWRGDLALGANFQSQFSVGRSYKMAIRAGLNNKLSGQITLKTSSSDQVQIALVAILPIARAIYKNFWPGASENYSIY